jgi:hypothetical protein
MAASFVTSAFSEAWRAFIALMAAAVTPTTGLPWASVCASSISTG